MMVNCTPFDTQHIPDSFSNYSGRHPSEVCAKIPLRSIPETLTVGQIQDMLTAKGFYEHTLHPQRALTNSYTTLLIGDALVAVDCMHELMWATGLVVRASFDDALEVVSTLRYAGYSDWRVPTTEELASLLEPIQGMCYNHQAFAHFACTQVWSADQAENASGQAGWAIRFDQGTINAISGKIFLPLLLVRNRTQWSLDSKTGASVRGLPKKW